MRDPLRAVTARRSALPAALAVLVASAVLGGGPPWGSRVAASAGRARSLVAAYVPSLARFELGPGGEGGPGSFDFGGRWAVPVSGDWDGDGFDSVGIFFPSGGSFFLTNENGGGLAELSLSFGSFSGTVRPVAGDWHGIGKATAGVYLPEEGRFLLRSGHSESCRVEEVRFGPAKRSLLPVVGDWDGDGTTDLGVYDPEEALFRLSSKGAVSLQAFGPRGGFPIAGDWLGSGRWGVGVLDRKAGEVLLRLPAGETSRVPFPSLVAIPVAGRWRR